MQAFEYSPVERLLVEYTGPNISLQSISNLHPFVVGPNSPIVMHHITSFIKNLSENMVDVTQNPEYLDKLLDILDEMFRCRTPLTLNKHLSYLFIVIGSLIAQQAQIKGVSKQEAFDTYFRDLPLMQRLAR